MSTKVIRPQQTKLGGVPFRLTALLSALTFALAACSGGSTGSGMYNQTTTTDSVTQTTAVTNVASSSSGSVVLHLSSTTISAGSPGTVTAKVVDSKGAPIVGTLVAFSSSQKFSTVSPLSVMTDVNGEASASVVPNQGASGAEYILATADVPGSTLSLSTRVAYTVSPTAVTLGTLSASPASLAPYSASVLRVNVVGASPATPVTVNFSSTCASSNPAKAVLSPTSVVVTAGTTASTTYQDQACAGADRVTASIVGTGQTAFVDLSVTAPSAQTLQFLSTDVPTIYLAGSGGADTAKVSFVLKDQFGSPVKGADVAFSLDQTAAATLSFSNSKTDASGVATVSVKAGATPTPVRVRATATASGLSTVSNVLAINSGLPTQKAVSLSATAYNIEGMDIDGVTSDLSMRLSDRFANPVPDGTAVGFVASGGAIVPANCITVAGACVVKFVSANFRPSDGRIPFTAWARGEESFIDQNGDLIYTLGEPFADLGKVFVDKNENGLIDAAQGEYHMGADPNSTWDGDISVRAQAVMILSSSAGPRLFEVSGAGCTSTPMSTRMTFKMSDVGGPICRLSQSFCMRDANALADPKGGNPVAAGTVLSIATKANGASIQVDGTPVGSTLYPTFHTITVDLNDCTKPLAGAGYIDMAVTFPKSGAKYTFNMGVINP